MRLSAETIGQLPGAAARPHYDRAQPIGIVHFGIGAFHRAHQAVYTDACLEGGENGWMIAGVSMRSASVADQLNPQDGLYTLTVRSAGESETRVIGVGFAGALSPAADRAAIVARHRFARLSPRQLYRYREGLLPGTRRFARPVAGEEGFLPDPVRGPCPTAQRGADGPLAAQLRQSFRQRQATETTDAGMDRCARRRPARHGSSTIAPRPTAWSIGSFRLPSADDLDHARRPDRACATKGRYSPKTSANG